MISTGLIRISEFRAIESGIYEETQELGGDS